MKNNFINIMKRFFDAYVKWNIPFFILGAISLILLIISWIAPPPMQIHETVLQAVAEIFGFAALWTIVLAVEKGTGASLKKGDMELEIKEDHNQEKEAED